MNDKPSYSLQFEFSVLGCLATIVLGLTVVAPVSAEDADPAIPSSDVIRTRRASIHRHIGGQRDSHKDVDRPNPDAHTDDMLHSQFDAMLIDAQDVADATSERLAWTKDYGVELSGSLILDHSHNLKGGDSTRGSATGHLLDVALTVDLETVADIDGGTVFIDFQNHNGEDGSVDTGDAQGISNIAADVRTQVAEFWYEQTFADNTVRILVGKRDANAEFAFVDYGGEFLNGSFGVSPNIVGLPTYPDPSVGIVAFIYPGDRHTQDVQPYFGIGVFDGSGHEGIQTGSRGPKTFIAEPADLFVIGESGVTWGNTNTDLLPGRAALGAWGHTGTFEAFDRSIKKGTQGFYLVFDQLISPENPEDLDDDQGIGFFFQYGYADPEVSEIEHHVGAGVQIIGPLEGRDKDLAGVGFTAAIFSDESGILSNEEITIEAFYEAHLSPLVSMQPDLQYIINPGGGTGPDAVVATIRTIFEF